MKVNFSVIIILWMFSWILLAANRGHAQQNSVEPDMPEFKFVPTRLPGYPLKTETLIYTSVNVQKALYNIKHFGKAKAIKETILRSADKWLEWEDEDIRFIMTDARVPRGFDLNPQGCPVHGDSIFKKGGAYPWIVDPLSPFKVKCPVGEEIYPSNDYATFYKSDFSEKRDWNKGYTDNGWGWIAPDGQRYWFIAYANHWIWKDHLEPAILNLGRAYVLTGDKRYAHKAAVMLNRLAEIYPSMDYANQSRYGYMLKQQGGVYNGKVFNLIWETSFIQAAAETYDAVWNTIDDDTVLLRNNNKTGKEVRAFIEANVLEDALDGYLSFKIQGNYGMHQSALLYVLLARQNMDTKKYIDMIVNSPGVSRVQSGIRYALYNMIFRDGTPLESPSYNTLTIEQLAILGDLLKKSGYDIFSDYRMLLLFKSPIEMVVARKFTPDIGDSGNTLGGIVGLNSNAYQIAYHNYRLPEMLNWLEFMQKTGENSFDSYPSLFRTVIADSTVKNARANLPARKSRLFAGYGMGVLNNRRDNMGIAVNYGYKGTHYHWDFLNVDLFAYGQKMMPDFGYPDAMNNYVKELFGWSTNTVAHNTVIVDARRQDKNNMGGLHHFSNGDFIRSIDVSSKPYEQVSTYRRNIIMVDVDSNSSYFADFFRIEGGRQHDYALHGPPGKAYPISGKWGKIQPGTFAGRKVKIGEIYDDALLNVPGYQGGYSSYKGSGYQYLFNVQQLKKGELITEYRHLNDSTAKLRIHIPESQNFSIFKADAFDKPRAKRFLVKYLLVRHQAAPSEDSLKTVFTSIWEPYHAEPVITGSKSVKVEGGYAKAIQVKRKNYFDIIISDTGNAVKRIPAHQIQTDAATAVVTLSEENDLKRVYFSDGTFLKWKEKEFRASPIKGVIQNIDVTKRRFIIKTASLPAITAASMDGKIMNISNAYKNTVHPIASAMVDKDLLEVTTSDDLIVGKLKVDSTNAEYIFTSTTLPFAELYRGTTLLDKDMQPVALITDVVHKGAKLKILTNGGHISSGDDLWICNIALDDLVEIKTMLEVRED